MPEQDEHDEPRGDAEAAEDDSVDSFLRAAARLPGDPSLEANAPTSVANGLHEGLLVAKRYRLERLLGEGGMGIVWAATHTVTGRSSALKFLKGSTRIGDDLRRRFLREARVVKTIDHPNLVDVRDVFELEDGAPVMVMDLLSGETLGARLKREQRLSVAQAAAVLVPVISAVGAAHAAGIVHRDLKPENIFLVRDAASGDAVKVLDFGVAKLADGATEPSESGMSTGTGAVLGTACYMAPEQALGRANVDHRADVWALGVILYECLSGERPVKATSVGQAVLQMMGAGIEPLDRLVPSLPEAVTTVVTRMLTRDRAARPASLHEVSEILVRYTSVRAPSFAQPMYPGHGNSDAFAPTVAGRVASPPRVRAIALALTSAGICAAFGLAVYRGRSADGHKIDSVAGETSPHSDLRSTAPSARPLELSLPAPRSAASSVAGGSTPAGGAGSASGPLGGHSASLDARHAGAAPVSMVRSTVPRTTTVLQGGPTGASSAATTASAKSPDTTPARRGLADQVPF